MEPNIEAGRNEGHMAFQSLMQQLHCMTDEARLLWFSGFYGVVVGTMAASIGVEASLAIIETLKEPMLSAANAHAEPVKP